MSRRSDLIAEGKRLAQEHYKLSMYSSANKFESDKEWLDAKNKVWLKMERILSSLRRRS